jgi:two-component system phosphate regulon sensor histidine kinase PhoR
MNKFRLKLTLAFVLLIAISVIGSGIFAAVNLKKSHMDSLRDSMLREINMIMAMVPWSKDLTESDLAAYYSETAGHLKQYTDSRITFMNADGKVLGDSDVDAREMDNHFNREEIAEARETGKISYSQRFSDTVKQNMLNAAFPVTVEGEVVGYLRLGRSLKEIESSIYELWSYFLIGLVILFVIAALISYHLAKGLTKPLENIMTVARQIRNMNYRARVKIKSKDEIGKLGEAINNMASSLEIQMNRILENENRLESVLGNMVSGVIMIDRDQKIALVNRSAENILGLSSNEILGKRFDNGKQNLELIEIIQECIDKRMSIRDEMVFYYPTERVLEINLVPLLARHEWIGVVIVLHDISDIRRLERMRSEFVANVSHELKTPVASVKGFAETLLSGAMDDKETAKSFLQIIYDESERLNRLINDILELSKIESKRASLDYSPIDMAHFIKTSIRMLKAEAAKKDIEVELKISEGIYIEADEDRLRQIFINLISNGINYTPEGGRVKIKVEPLLHSDGDEYETVRITIADTGIGIPKKDLPRIFERFYRVDKARSRSSGGTGLGLSIVKHLVELHKGSISVQSELGMGTRFYIDLPVIQKL